MLTPGRASVAFALAFALIGSATAQSRHKSPNAVPPQKAAEPERAPQTDKRGTAEQPLSVNVVPTTEQKADAEKEKANTELKDADERKLVEYTGYLVFVGIVQFSVFVLQLIAFSVQASYMRRSVAEMQSTTSAAIRGAKAAEDTVNTMKDTSERQLRAFVFGKGFSSGINIDDSGIREYIIFVPYENVGLTPATNFCSWIDFQTFATSEYKEVMFSPRHPGVPISLGPRATVQSLFIRIPLDTMIKNWRNEIEILVWSRAEYRDVFDPNSIRHHEQCARVELIHEPSTPPPPNYPSYIQFFGYGRQNSSS